MIGYAVSNFDHFTVAAPRTRPSRAQARRPSGRAVDQFRAGGQPQDRQCAGLTRRGDRAGFKIVATHESGFGTSRTYWSTTAYVSSWGSIGHGSPGFSGHFRQHRSNPAGRPGAYLTRFSDLPGAIASRLGAHLLSSDLQRRVQTDATLPTCCRRLQGDAQIGAPFAKV